jgi:hypothetical protein
MLKISLLLVVLAAAPCGLAAPKSTARDADKYQAWRSATEAVLIARADADSLATAAALRHADSVALPKGGAARTEPSALELAAHASELAPQSASIGWLHLQLCAATPGCDIRDVATVLRWVDADNGAAWLQTLAVAQRERDSTEVERVLGDMARSQHFDFYWNRIVVLMVGALEAARDQLPGGIAGSDSARLSASIGIASGEVIPSVTPLLESCREPGSSAAERRELCFKLSKIMQRGDTVVAQLAGFNIERHLVAPDGREARAIAERRRILDWRTTEAGKFDSPLLPWTKNARARARLALMRAKPREEDVSIAILQSHKVALDPPEVHP